jgi:hypothetical protein
MGPSAVDRLLACAQRLAGKPVVRHTGLDNRLRIEPCPAGRDGLLDRLAREKIRYFDAGDFGFLIPGRFLSPFPPDLSPYAPRFRWSRIRIRLAVEPGSGVAPAAADAIAREALAAARTIPVVAPEEAGADGAAETAIHARFLAAALKPGAPAAVLVLLEQLPESTAGRLVYGEMREGKYRVLWDSPLFNASGRITLEDVNGDGWQEIVVESQSRGNQTYPVLVIFDRAGRELTRQAKCDTLNEGFDEVDGVCAIKGTDLELAAGDKGTRVIRVTGWDGDGKNHVFHLQGGRYVPGPPSK